MSKVVFNLLAGMMLAAAISIIWAVSEPAAAHALFQRIDAAVLDGFLVSYFDRATWITGCF